MSELRKLVEEWRERACVMRHGASSSKRGDEGDIRRRDALRLETCAAELEAALAAQSAGGGELPNPDEIGRKSVGGDGAVAHTCDFTDGLDADCKACHPAPSDAERLREALTDAQCEAVYKAVSMANITRDVKSPERKCQIVRAAIEDEK